MNGVNKKAWNEFLSEQSNFASFYRGDDPVIKNANMGLKAFRSSIDLFDEDLTEVYVAFASNKIWDQKNNIDTSSIAMFIIMDTSENAKFISHVGISRAPIYQANTNAPKHANLAVKLHSFIAACAKKIYHDEKKYMILHSAAKYKNEIILE